MKISNWIIILVLLTVGVCSYFVYQNSQKIVFDFHPEGVHEGRGDMENFEQDKVDSRNKILIIGLGVAVFFLIIYFSAVKQEDKRNPIKNLEKLKNNAIITEAEYHSKVNEVVNLKERDTKEKEKKKIILELDNLRTKGIIDETEYLEKIKLINVKFNS